MNNRYFAASNSSRGFQNYFNEVFCRADFIYVVKGGPGTGKSSFMKRCSKYAADRGLAVENYCCSSDADSLDGVLIFDGKRSIGVLDGTAPHVWEATQPGIREQIVDLGQFWDNRLVIKHKNEIVALNRKKSAAYNKAYTYLRSCGNLRTVTDMLLRESLNGEKMARAVERIVDSLCLDHGGEATIIPTPIDAVTMKGCVSFDTFRQKADKIYLVGYAQGIGQLLLCELERQFRKKNICMRIAYDAVCPWLINGIFIDDINTAFLVGDADDNGDGSDETNEKYINSKRFIDNDALRAARSEIRYTKKLSQSSLEGAIHALSEVSVYHFLLEDIYKNAMDFKALTEFTNNFINKFI